VKKILRQELFILDLNGNEVKYMARKYNNKYYLFYDDCHDDDDDDHLAYLEINTNDVACTENSSNITKDKICSLFPNISNTVLQVSQVKRSRIIFLMQQLFVMV
jgi:hypothetical protein